MQFIRNSQARSKIENHLSSICEAKPNRPISVEARYKFQHATQIFDQILITVIRYKIKYDRDELLKN